MKQIVKVFLKKHVPCLSAVKRKMVALNNAEARRRWLLKQKKTWHDWLANNTIVKRYIGYCNLRRAHFEMRETAKLKYREIVPAFPAYLDLLSQHLQKEVSTVKRQPHLLLYSDTLGPGGAERQWVYLACELARRGYKTTLLIDKLDGINGYYLPLLTGSSVQICCLEELYCPPESLPTDALGFHWTVPSLVQALRFLQPTHVLSQRDWPNALMGMAVAIAEIPVQKHLLSFRNVNPSQFDVRLAEFSLPIYKLLLQSPRCVLSGNSKYGNSDYANWLGISTERIACVHNAVHFKNFSASVSRKAMRKQLNVSDDAPTVLGVFRISDEKNPMLFLDVIHKIKQELPNIVALHAGMDLSQNLFYTRTKELGLKKTLRCLGVRSDIKALMHASDVLLMTSKVEGLPNVILEAQTMGLAVVATRVGGTLEAVCEGKTALLAESGDAETLAQHCLTLFRDPALAKKMGDTGKTYSSQHFTMKRYGDQILAALELPGFLF